jgi:hypothetical protein
MAVIFHTPTAINGLNGAWTALPALPAGVDPMRRVILKVTNTAQTTAQPFRVGFGTAGGTGDVANVYVDNAGTMDLGVCHYPSVIVRRNDNDSGTPNGFVFCMSFSQMDEGPRGVS